jgi:hypothetical protein
VNDEHTTVSFERRRVMDADRAPGRIDDLYAMICEALEAAFAGNEEAANEQLFLVIAPRLMNLMRRREEQTLAARAVKASRKEANTAIAVAVARAFWAKHPEMVKHRKTTAKRILASVNRKLAKPVKADTVYAYIQHAKVVTSVQTSRFSRSRELAVA